MKDEKKSVDEIHDEKNGKKNHLEKYTDHLKSPMHKLEDKEDTVKDALEDKDKND